MRARRKTGQHGAPTLIEQAMAVAAVAIVLACTLGVGPFRGAEGPDRMEASSVASLHR